MSTSTFLVGCAVVLLVFGCFWAVHAWRSDRGTWRARLDRVRGWFARPGTKTEQNVVSSTTAGATLSDGVSDLERDVTAGRADPTRQVCLGTIIPTPPLSEEVRATRESMRAAIRGSRSIPDPAKRYRAIREHQSDLIAAYSPIGLSTLVVGPSGTGKSSGIIIPATLTAGCSSMLNLSVKRDVAVATIVQRQKVAQRWNETKPPDWPKAFCRVFDPSGAQYLPECLRAAHVFWSPLTLILNDATGDLTTAKNLAASMVDAAGSDASAHRSDTEAFWRNSAARLLSRVMFAVVATKGAQACMWDVCKAIASLNADGRAADLEEALKEHIATLAGEHTEGTAEPARLRAARACMQTLGETAQHLARNAGGQVSGVLGNLQNTLECFEEAALGGHKAGNDTLPFDQLLDSWSTLYLTADGVGGKVYRPVLAALTDALLDYAAAKAGRSADGRLVVPMLACLDELTNLSAMDAQKLVRLISTARGYNMSVILAFQDLSQLTARFGEAVTRTIVSNTHARIFLPKNGDSETAKTAEVMFGARQAPNWTMSFTPSVKSKSWSKSTGDGATDSKGASVTPDTYSESLSLREEPILPAHRLASSTELEAWAWVSGFTYHLLQRRYYSDPLYAALASGQLTSTDLAPALNSTTLDEVSPEVISEVAREQLRRLSTTMGRPPVNFPVYPRPQTAPDIVGRGRNASRQSCATPPLRRASHPLPDIVANPPQSHGPVDGWLG